MDWQARLAKRRDTLSERADTDPPKLTKPPFVGSVSAPDGHSENIASHAGHLRERLLAAAAAEHADPDLIHQLPAADVDACDALPDSVLHAYVRAAEVIAERMAGHVPADETAPALCVHCGPVWLAPGVAALMPQIHGTPRVMGCPWCHVRKAGRYVPRPTVQCAACAHYVPDDVNPAGGAGHCGLHPDDIHRMHWPKQRHRCGDWQPMPSRTRTRDRLWETS